MKRFVTGLLGATMVVGMTVAAAPQAHAVLVSIGLQESGVNGGAITTETTGAGNASISGVSYGTFTLNNVSGTGAPFLVSPDFDTNSLNAVASSAGTLNVFITESGITSPVGGTQLLSSFTENSITSGWTVTESTWLDNANGTFTKVTALGNGTFSVIGTNQVVTAASLGSDYSITVEYSIVSNGAGSDNSTVDIQNVPEPMSVGLLGLGLLGLGLLRRKKII